MVTIFVLFIILSIIFSLNTILYFSKRFNPIADLYKKVGLKPKFKPEDRSEDIEASGYEIKQLGMKNYSIKYYQKIINSKKAVILCHGYNRSADSNLERAAFLQKLGYDIYMPDFSGHGASDLSGPSYGYKESKELEKLYNKIKSRYNHIVLFGTSMGAVSILRATDLLNVKPDSVILECPFINFIRAVEIKLSPIKAFNSLLVYPVIAFASIISGYRLFGINNIRYAGNLTAPVLHIAGDNDYLVSIKDSIRIFKALKSEKKKLIFFEAGHDDYYAEDRVKWEDAVENFLVEQTL